MHYWRKNPGQRRKSDGTPVSEADEAVDRLLQDLLRAPHPDIAWLSEESAESAETRRRPLAWIIDPIDGTSQFLAGREEYCIAACLTLEGTPVASAIAYPPRAKVFSASLGDGATLNGEHISVTDASSLDAADILSNGRMFGAVPPPGLLPNPAMCLALAWVAAGHRHAVAAAGLKSDWDLAAGALLVQEAGGVASRLDGLPFRFNGADPRQPGLIAAGPQLHALLRNRLSS